MNHRNVVVTDTQIEIGMVENSGGKEQWTGILGIGGKYTYGKKVFPVHWTISFGKNSRRPDTSCQ